jgi:hypothetical protein
MRTNDLLGPISKETPMKALIDFHKRSIRRRPAQTARQSVTTLIPDEARPSLTEVTCSKALEAWADGLLNSAAWHTHVFGLGAAPASTGLRLVSFWIAFNRFNTMPKVGNN